MAGTDSDYQATLNLLNSIGKPQPPQRPQATKKITTPEIKAGASNLLGKWLAHFITGYDPLRDAPMPGDGNVFTGRPGSQRVEVFRGTE